MNNDLIKQLRDFGEVADVQTSNAHGDFHRKIADALDAQDRRIAELEAALLVRLDRKVLNDTWEIRAEKAEATLGRLARALSCAVSGLEYCRDLSERQDVINCAIGGVRLGADALSDPAVKRILEGT